MGIVHIVILLLFLFLGVLFWRGKGGALIAGYNTMPAREKENYDEKKFFRFMAKFMFALAACWAVAASSELFHAMILMWVGMALFFAVIFAGVIYANTKDRFKK